MKGRFITNAVLSATCLIGLILLFTGLVDLEYDSGLWVFGMVFLTGSSIASLVMGIVTLSMIKGVNQKGLCIASGVLAILGGAWGANIIVSIIGAVKE